ncbi:hypothetical protein [Flavobacterium sp.]|nr:hypothetical protein [Flavobacterium sp.]
MGRIGTTEIIVILIIPIMIFLIGYYFGKKSGYIKRVREEDQKK